MRLPSQRSISRLVISDLFESHKAFASSTVRESRIDRVRHITAATLFTHTGPALALAAATAAWAATALVAYLLVGFAGGRPAIG